LCEQAVSVSELMITGAPAGAGFNAAAARAAAAALLARAAPAEHAPLCPGHAARWQPAEQ